MAAFVSTNSICQGQSVSILWPVLFETGCDIRFAYTSFKWSNLASNKAGVTVVIVGIGQPTSAPRRLYEEDDEQNGVLVREGVSITPYLTLGPSIIVQKRDEPIGPLSVMEFGNKPSDGGHLLLSSEELPSLGLDAAQRDKFVRRIYGSHDFINGGSRLCIWIEDQNVEEALTIESLKTRIEAVRRVRLASRDKCSSKASTSVKVNAHRNSKHIVVPGVSSEARDYLPCGLLPEGNVINNKNFGIYDAPIWNMALIASRLHWVWIGTVCVRLEMRFSYSNTLGWNTFPVPPLTDKMKADLTHCAEEILLAREAHFPATIADLYDSENMPADLRNAHERNDEVLERIYIGRRFRNDTERLEKLFELYTKMTEGQGTTRKRRARANA